MLLVQFHISFSGEQKEIYETTFCCNIDYCGAFLVGVFDLLTKVRIACGHIVLSFCFCLVNLKEGR